MKDYRPAATEEQCLECPFCGHIRTASLREERKDHFHYFLKFMYVLH